MMFCEISVCTVVGFLCFTPCSGFFFLIGCLNPFLITSLLFLCCLLLFPYLFVVCCVVHLKCLATSKLGSFLWKGLIPVAYWCMWVCPVEKESRPGHTYDMSCIAWQRLSYEGFVIACILLLSAVIDFTHTTYKRLCSCIKFVVWLIYNMNQRWKEYVIDNEGLGKTSTWRHVRLERPLVCLNILKQYASYGNSLKGHCVKDLI